MRILGVLLLLMTIVLAVSCGDDDETTIGPAGIPFSLGLTVTDTSGNAVPNLEIKGRILLDTSTLAPKVAAGKTMAALLAPVFKYDVNADSRVTYVVYDMAGQVVDTLVDAVTVSGRHSALWNAADINDGVYTCEMRATAVGSGALLFSDRVYAAYLPELLTNTLHTWGYTDSEGQFSTSDSALFPGIFSLPTGMTSTDVFGIELGAFTFLDTIIIELTDTLIPVKQEYRIMIKPGLNEVSLTWNPPPPGSVHDGQEPDNESRASRVALAASSAAWADTAWMSISGNTVRVDSAASDLGGIFIVFDDSIEVTPIGSAARLEFDQSYLSGYTKVYIFPYREPDSVKYFGPGDVLQLSGAANVVHTDISNCDSPPRVMQIIWPGTPEWKLYQNYPNPFF